MMFNSDFISSFITKVDLLHNKLLDVTSTNAILIIPLTIINIFFFNVKWYFIIILSAIIVDIITGIIAAKKRNEKISSNRFFDSLIKIGYYFIIMLLLYCIDYFVIKDTFLLINISSIIIFINELLSIDENICNVLGHNTALTKLFKLAEKIYYNFIKNFFKNKL